MDGTPLISLVHNVTLLLAIAFLFDLAARRWHTGQSPFWQVPVGLAIGAIAIAVMLTPWTFEHGIVFDTRSVLLGIAGLFFGPASTATAMAMTAAFRFTQGGTGTWTGIAVILASGAIGIAWRYLRRRPLADISWRELYLFGIVVHSAMLLLMLTLPWTTALRVLSSIALPVILLYPLGTVLLGALMVNRLRSGQAEQALRESEDRYRSLCDNSIDAVLLTEPEGRILAANPEACRIFGRTEEEICRIGRAGLLDLTDPRLAAALQERERTGQFRGELTFVRKDGASFPGEISSVLFKDREGNVKSSMIIRDMTEHKRADQALRSISTRQESLLAAIPDIIMEVDDNRVYTWANQPGRDFFGTDVIGKDAAFYFEGEQETYDTVQPVFNGSEDVIYLESWQRRKDGEKRLLAWWCRGRKDENGRVIGALSSARDITEQKRSEQEIAILADIGRLIGSTLNIDEVYERFAAETRKLITFDRLSVTLNNYNQDTVTTAYAFGLDVPGRSPSDSFPLRGSVNEALAHSRTGMLFHPASVAEVTGQHQTLISTFQAGIRSFLSVPLIARDEVIGVLHFRSKRPNAYTDRDLRLAERIGAQIAGAIANARLFNDLKRTENSLRESEGRFRGLVEQAAVGVAEIIMETGRFVTVNRRLCELVGRTEEEMLATTFGAITHPEDLQLHRDKTRLLMAGEIGYYSMEKRYIRKDGESVWVNITVSPLWKPGEKPTRNMIVVEDIAGRKRAEEELRRNRDIAERLAEEKAIIAEIGRIISSTLDIEEVYEKFVTEARKLIPFDNLMINLINQEEDVLVITYVSGVDIPQRRQGDRFPFQQSFSAAIARERKGMFLNLDDRQTGEQFPQFIHALRAGLRSMMAVPLISRDRVIAALVFRSKERDLYNEGLLNLAERIGAQIAGAIANSQLFKDLSATEKSLRESEEKYRDLVEFLPISVFEADGSMRITSFNQTALETFRYTAEDPISAMDGRRFFLPEEWARLEKDVWKVMGGASRSSVEYKFLRKDGSTFTGLAYVSPIIRLSAVVGIRGAIIDITDRIKAMEELQKAQDYLLQSEKLAAIGRLAAGVAHEILNPVNIISLALQILMRGNEISSQAKQEMTVCMEQIDRIVTIADNLKRASRIKGNSPAAGDIAAVVDHVLALYLPQLKMNGIKTDVRYPPDLPKTVMDMEKIEQVILNLLDNAVSAMENKQEKVLRVTIGQGTVIGRKAFLRVTIADTGTGISKQGMQKLFEPFFTTKEPGKGTGLGLSISFGIIQDHGGRIWAENNEWGGASFIFEIPLTSEKDGTGLMQRR
ncbi:MAG: PAS domain S-box protein [Syntrophales bacterium]